MNIAIIEDDPSTSRLLHSWLTTEYPAAALHQYFDADAAIRAVETSRFDLVSLDWDLGKARTSAAPEIILALARSEGKGRRAPILIYSGKDPQHEFRHMDITLSMGYEYLAKSADAAEDSASYLATVRSLLSRIRKEAFELDVPEIIEVRLNGRLLELSLTQIRLLSYIYARRHLPYPHCIAKYEDLYPLTANNRHSPNALAHHILQIRSALKLAQFDCNCIQAEDGKGYYWRPAFLENQ